MTETEQQDPWGLGRPLRVFNVPWHVAHQYEIYKLPNTEFSQVVNSVRKWGRGKDGVSNSWRPYPSNVTQVPYYEPGYYDFALLHVDQQCIDPKIGKGQLYRELNSVIKDVPKIVINHGTPYWPEVYEQNYIRTKMKFMLQGNHVVMNSHRAADMWGNVGVSQNVILHGMDTDEWWDLPKEPRVVTMLTPAGLDKYYNRRLLSDVMSLCRQRGIPHEHITVTWQAEDWDDYRDFLGRSLLYFNPTLESPMPRARTEAMLSGACVLTLPNHGAEDFIKSGENGWIVPNNPKTVVELIDGLLQGGHYERCIEIGQRGKKTAQELFELERFHDDWITLIKNVLDL